MEFKRLGLTSAAPSDFTLEALRQLVPSAFTEVRGEGDKLTYKVDFDHLREMLGDAIADADEERYGFYWVGKQDAKREAAKPTRQTLRPVEEESVAWESTQNLYIEGDNLAVLKLLQTAYIGKVKMIYIDPPYNTGNDFVYNDDFSVSREEQDEAMGNLDEEGNRLRRNLDSNPRYHSDWCSMIYSRLLVARTLLSSDGVIFISIDDNEVHNLRKICDEVFGPSNFVGELPTIMNLKGNQDQFGFAGTHEYTLVYAKRYDQVILNGLSIDEETVDFDWEVDNVGYYKRGAGLVSTGTNSPREHRPRLWYPIFVTAQDKLIIPPKEELDKFYDSNTKTFNDEYLYSYIDQQEKAGVGDAILPRVKGREARWRWGSDRIRNDAEEIIVSRTKRGITLYKKQRPEIGELPSRKPKTLFYKPEYSSGNGTRELEDILQAERLFSNPKPLQLLYDFCQIGSDKDSLILDFFSGSATTAHAVMQLNAEDGGKRKYIIVQLPEKTPEGSEARKAGYDTICEIGKERIRRAGRQIKEELGLLGDDLDIGFRVLRLDSSNMEEVYFEPGKVSQASLFSQVDSVKRDRTPLDLLFDCMVDWGVELSLPIRREEVGGKELFVVNDGALVACFEEEIPLETIRYLAGLSPQRLIFRESSFATDADKLNVYEQFKQLCSWSEEESYRNIRVI